MLKLDRAAKGESNEEINQEAPREGHLVTRAVSKHVATDGVHKWEWRIGPPKSEKSNRRVALPESVIRLLSSLRGDRANLESFIFGGAEGLFMTPDHFDEFVFKPVAERAELTGVRFHDLRHFFGSMLIAQGENAKYVCDQMGYSSIQVTFDTYGHLSPSGERRSGAETGSRDVRRSQVAEW